MKWLRYLRDDVFGGLVSAAVAIPLALGYGMFAFASLGENYFATGAMAGLASALVVGVVCVVLGEATTTVYAPRVTSTFFLGFLIYGLVHSNMPAVAAGGTPLVLAVAFAIVLLGGAFEALFGAIRLGSLIKFTPQPVMAGFQNAAALLLFLVQLGNVCGFDHTVPFTQVPHYLASVRPVSLAIAAITFATMWNARRIIPKIPPMLVAIVVGCVFYYGLKLAGYGAYLGPVIASEAPADLGPTAFPSFAGLAHDGIIWAFAPTIVGGALALAIIASIDALLCAKLVATPGEPRRDGNALLLRLGLGNVAAACAGGITGGLNIGASNTNRAFGARTPLSVLVNAAALLVAGVWLFRWLGLMPRTVLSAVIMVIAVQHFDLWNLRLLRGLRKDPLLYRFNVVLDVAVMIVVAALSVTVNIVLAVFVGVAIAIALFVLRMSRSIVRRSYRGGTVHSRKSRIEPERAFLEFHGDAIAVMELQGALFFGTGERMLNDIEITLDDATRCVILDLRRLTEIDSTGASILLELKSRLAQRKCELLLAVAVRSTAMERLEDFGALAALGKNIILPDADRALERAEDDLLRFEPLARPKDEPIVLSRVGIFSRFSADDLKIIESFLRRTSYRPGEVVFHEGEPGNQLLVVSKGSASAYLQLPNGNIRLATFEPGTMFGEVALLDSGPRSATVKAENELVCYALNTKDFSAMAGQFPSIAIRLLAAIGSELSGRLRAANRTIHQLET
jgi:MFS superfamily sulfate permease-like transporter